MLNRTALVSVTTFAMVMLLILGVGVEAAPTERGEPGKSLALNPGQYLRQWFWSAKAARVDGTTKSADKTSVRSITGGTSAGRLRINPETTGPDKRTQMLKMISALEELHRMFNSTLSSRITIMPRGNGRNSAKKNKSPPAAEGGQKSTTAPPAAADSTASRASSDVVVPSLTGRNFRKSLSPQPKKTNKRVCFWKYCSQN
ncbi:urotensin II-related peptide [Mastacembelus armatus]|uniref:urotensin II-related peptide n=1 Tax=Mastacembelus armatus TaxID=205130 RepID=UPI000E456EF4|nr:uncharacterized protein LOC113127582 [Mastacembelus armatus]